MTSMTSTITTIRRHLWWALPAHPDQSLAALAARRLRRPTTEQQLDQVVTQLDTLQAARADLVRQLQVEAIRRRNNAKGHRSIHPEAITGPIRVPARHAHAVARTTQSS